MCTAGTGCVVKIALGLAIQVLRRQRASSQEALAAEAGITRAQLSRIEKGRVEPGFFTVMNLLTALDVHLGQFEDEMKRHFPPPHMERNIDDTVEGILQYSGVGKIDASNYGSFMRDVFDQAMGDDDHPKFLKILVNLRKVTCELASEPQFRQTKEWLAWLKAKSFWPAVAFVGNGTFDSVVATIAQYDGLKVAAFNSVQAALDWLRQADGNKPDEE